MTYTQIQDPFKGDRDRLKHLIGIDESVMELDMIRIKMREENDNSKLPA